MMQEASGSSFVALCSGWLQAKPLYLVSTWTYWLNSTSFPKSGGVHSQIHSWFHTGGADSDQTCQSSRKAVCLNQSQCLLELPMVQYVSAPPSTRGCGRRALIQLWPQTGQFQALQQVITCVTLS